MNLKVLAVGSKPPDWVKLGLATYTDRLANNLKFQLQEIPPSKHNRDPQRFVKEEGERILAKVDRRDWMVMLDERGKAYDSRGLAQRLAFWQSQGSDVVFAVGGSDGLSSAVKERSNETLSLSPLTLPHHLVKVMLVEALYRAWSINNGHPYHRA